MCLQVLNYTGFPLPHILQNIYLSYATLWRVYVQLSMEYFVSLEYCFYVRICTEYLFLLHNSKYIPVTKFYRSI